MYKYFSYTEQGYWHCNYLLSEKQIGTMSTNLGNEVEKFKTIQNYTSNGDIHGTYVYFDIDEKNLYDAMESTQELVNGLLGVDAAPLVSFSGSKGFHVVVPYYITHSRCHDVVGIMSKEFGVSVDPKVYKTRAMWRMNGSINRKSNRYKVPVSVDRVMSGDLDSIIKMAEMNKGDSVNVVYKHNGYFDELTRDAISELPELTQQQVSIGDGSTFWDDMPICLRKIWELPSPPEGERHKTAHLMARYCFKSGLTKAEAITLFCNHSFWGSVTSRDYSKVVESIYRNGNGMLGCKGGDDGKLLRLYCSKACWFNDYNIKDVFNGGIK